MERMLHSDRYRSLPKRAQEKLRLGPASVKALEGRAGAGRLTIRPLTGRSGR